MEKAIIVAYDTNRAIGQGGDLPWGRSLPADLANFKRLTKGSDVIMGRKTFESIGCRPLPERENIVISSRPTGVKGVLTAVNLESALALARYKTFIIGGAQVYDDALNTPEIDMTTWQEVSRVHHPADTENKYDFDFVMYRRII